jgi:hypothetical protein
LGDLGDLQRCLIEVSLELFPVLDTAFTFHHGQQASDCLLSLMGLLQT